MTEKLAKLEKSKEKKSLSPSQKKRFFYIISMNTTLIF